MFLIFCGIYTYSFLLRNDRYYFFCEYKNSSAGGLLRTAGDKACFERPFGLCGFCKKQKHLDVFGKEKRYFFKES